MGFDKMIQSREMALHQIQRNACRSRSSAAPTKESPASEKGLPARHRSARSFLRRSIVLVALAATACSSREPFDASLQAQGRYLCTNLRFDDAGAATDANYWYSPQGETLLVGTRIVVSGVSAYQIKFRTSDSFKEYKLALVYGREQLSAEEYFRRVLCVENPTQTLSEANAKTREAILQGRLLVGMTRPQVLMARGYPPANRTPDLDSDHWRYFRTGRLVDELSFQDDRVISVKSVRSSKVD